MDIRLVSESRTKTLIHRYLFATRGRKTGLFKINYQHLVRFLIPGFNLTIKSPDSEIKILIFRPPSGAGWVGWLGGGGACAPVAVVYWFAPV